MTDREITSVLDLEQAMEDIRDHWLGKKRTWRPIEGAMWDMSEEDRKECQDQDSLSDNL
jgi:hypothetical protein